MRRSWSRTPSRRSTPSESAWATPSLATALGSSGERPSALAELMGILANGGLRRPTRRIEGLRFAAGTPYETVLGPRPAAGERVLAPEVATGARTALRSVVEGGTAQRLERALKASGGASHVVGGKTGTGDERVERGGRGGRILERRYVSRAAVFTFLIDDRFFGVLSACVQGEDAGRYGFTSALPVELVGGLLGELRPLLDSPAAAEAS